MPLAAPPLRECAEKRNAARLLVRGGRSSFAHGRGGEEQDGGKRAEVGSDLQFSASVRLFSLLTKESGSAVVLYELLGVERDSC